MEIHGHRRSQRYGGAKKEHVRRGRHYHDNQAAESLARSVLGDKNGAVAQLVKTLKMDRRTARDILA